MSKLKQFFTTTAGTNPMDRIQTAIERIILYSRFILVIFYLGLGVALAAFAMNFVVKLYVTLPN